MSEDQTLYNMSDVVHELRQGHRAASNRAGWFAGCALAAVLIYVCQPEQHLGSPVPNVKCVTLRPGPDESLDAMLEDILRQHPRMQVETATATPQGLVVCYRSKFAR